MSKASSPPTISVVTPTFNARSTLVRALDSVALQKWRHTEHVVVDGGSTDGTRDVLQGRQGLRWSSEPDRGIYDAMNKGASMATGDWLLFLGADDILVDCLHRIAPLLRDPRRIYYGDAYFPGKNKVVGGRFDWRRICSQNICHQAILYPRGVFADHAFDLRFPILADYELNLRLWHRYRFTYLPHLVAIHSDDGVSMRAEDTAFLEGKAAIIEREFALELRRARWLDPLRKSLLGLRRRLLP